MDKIMIKGRTIEDAIHLALKELELTRDAAEIRILSEGRSGLFGLIGRKDAEVEVERKDDLVFYQDMLSRILKSMGFSVDVNTSDSNGTVYLNVEDTNELGGLLIGKSGRNLNALEHLIKKIGMNNGFKQKRVILDIENYKKRNEVRIRSRHKRGKRHM
ncbi:MAG: hypothetical protein B6244_12525 [Candidatus Cloacimonetes bacterium 4572_55]|nr:MAG: hypothetical protein B6244_12525 [Candidatus Cloacimonetes bacterium 4572_55]